MPKICIVRLESICGGYECDPSIVQDSDWFEVTDEELEYFKIATRDYDSKIYNHGIIIKPELNIEEIKLKCKEYYDKIVLQQKAKEVKRKKAEKEKSEANAKKALAKKLKKLEQLQLELGITPKSE